ncbi:MAG: heme exporter protein CcmB [Caulobacterales bacterium]|jgi:heme exporter protein B
MLTIAASQFRRDLVLAWASGGGAAAPIGFFIGTVVLLPLAVGPERLLISAVGPPLLWVAGALAVLMTLERLFQADLEDGGLDQMLLASAPLELLVAAKGLALWVAIGVPMAIASVPLALTLQTPPTAAPIVAIGLGVGMAGFIGAGLVGAALTAGVRRGGVLIAILVLPLFSPPIIFGAAAAAAAANGEGLLTSPFQLLSATALFYSVLGPIAAAAALRLQAD